MKIYLITYKKNDLVEKQDFTAKSIKEVISISKKFFPEATIINIQRIN